MQSPPPPAIALWGHVLQLVQNSCTRVVLDTCLLDVYLIDAS